MTNPTQQEKISEIFNKVLASVSWDKSIGYSFSATAVEKATAQIQNLITEGKIELLQGVKYKPLTSLRIVVGGELVSDDTILDLVNRCSTSAVEEARDNLINQLKEKE